MNSRGKTRTVAVLALKMPTHISGLLMPLVLGSSSFAEVWLHYYLTAAYASLMQNMLNSLSLGVGVAMPIAKQHWL